MQLQEVADFFCQLNGFLNGCIFFWLNHMGMGCDLLLRRRAKEYLLSRGLLHEWVERHEAGWQPHSERYAEEPRGG